MTEYVEYDKIINVSGLDEDEVPIGDVASWSHPDKSYHAAIQTFCEPDIYCPKDALRLFVNVVTILKNNFYMSIAERVIAQSQVELSDEALRDFAISLDNKGFGKTVLLGDYRNPEFMKMVVDWCDENNYFVLYPFAMDCSLEEFAEKQMVMFEHDTVC